MRKIKDLVPGSRQLSAKDQNALRDEVKRLGTLNVEGGEIIDDGSGRTIVVNHGSPGFWARITDSANPTDGFGPFSWIRQNVLQDGSFEDMEYGPHGEWDDEEQPQPLYQVNGLELQIDDIVWIQRGAVWVSEGTDYDEGTIITEWLTDTSLGGESSSDAEQITISGGPVDVNGTDYWWGHIDTYNPGDPNDPNDAGGWSISREVWLVQRFNYTLRVGGCYLSLPTNKRKRLTFDLLERFLYVYTTTEFPAYGEDCELLN